MTGLNHQLVSQTFQGQNLAPLGTFSFYRFASPIFSSIFSTRNSDLKADDVVDSSLFISTFSGFLGLVFIPIWLASLIMNYLKKSSAPKNMKTIQSVEVLLSNIYYAALNGALGDFLHCYCIQYSSGVADEPLTIISTIFSNFMLFIYLALAVRTFVYVGLKTHFYKFKDLVSTHKNHQVLFSGCRDDDFFQDHFLSFYLVIRVFVTLIWLTQLNGHGSIIATVLQVLLQLLLIRLTRQYQPFYDPINQKQFEITESINTAIIVLIGLHNSLWNSERVAGPLVFILYLVQRGVVLYFSFIIIEWEAMKRCSGEKRNKAYDNNAGSLKAGIPRIYTCSVAEQITFRDSTKICTVAVHFIRHFVP